VPGHQRLPLIGPPLHLEDGCCRSVDRAWRGGTKKHGNVYRTIFSSLDATAAYNSTGGDPPGTDTHHDKQPRTHACVNKHTFTQTCKHATRNKKYIQVILAEHHRWRGADLDVCETRTSTSSTTTTGTSASATSTTTTSTSSSQPATRKTTSLVVSLHRFGELAVDETQDTNRGPDEEQYRLALPPSPSPPTLGE
jgi:hypothetical protein